jgi:hypothetical protein
MSLADDEAATVTEARPRRGRCKLRFELVLVIGPG